MAPASEPGLGRRRVAEGVERLGARRHRARRARLDTRRGAGSIRLWATGWCMRLRAGCMGQRASCRRLLDAYGCRLEAWRAGGMHTVAGWVHGVAGLSMGLRAGCMDKRAGCLRHVDVALCGDTLRRGAAAREPRETG
eukprot:scaffold61852_cov34-Phaeocystis_antarctica.AAC.3